MVDIHSTYRMQMQQSINCLSDLCGLQSPSLPPYRGGRRRGSFGSLRMMSEIFIIPQKKKEPKKKNITCRLCR